MAWKIDKCQLCGGEAKYKELDSPDQKKYACGICGEYWMKFQIDAYPNLKKAISNCPSEEIARCLQELRGACSECIEIVLSESSDKKKNQISLAQLIDKAGSTKNT